MAEILFTNNASTTLFTTIDEQATELTVAPGTGALFPTVIPSKDEHFRVTIISTTGDFEIVKVTARVNDRFTIERAQEGTIARSFEQNSIVELRLTAGSISWIAENLARLDNIVAINTAVMKGASSSLDGASGIVPKPIKGSQDKVLCGNATWVDIKDIPSFSELKTNVDTLTSKVMPVGSIYVQFANQSDPTTLFGGTWSNISSEFKGLFFRAEGGKAAEFGGTQPGGLPNATGVAHNLRTLGGGLYSNSFYLTQAVNSSGYTGNEPKSVGGFSMDLSKSNYLFGAADEVRPENSTIRIWKRTN